MPIETAAYISDLNSSNPPDADPISQADDHLRLLKATIKATFPNVTGPVTATQSQLNGYTPAGVIAWWYGLTTNVPTGWALCDGRTVARTDGSGNITTPNLTDTFIRAAAGGSVTPGSTGGALTHSHNLTIAGHVLATSELPAHNHGVNDAGHGHGVTDPGHLHQVGIITGVNQAGFNNSSPIGSLATTANTSSATTGITINSATTGITIQNAGGGLSHGHTGSTSDSQSNVPPYIGLVPIMKV